MIVRLCGFLPAPVLLLLSPDSLDYLFVFPITFSKKKSSIHYTFVHIAIIQVFFFNFALVLVCCPRPRVIF